MNKSIGNTTNHKPYKFPSEKNGYKILEHLDFKPKTKRYVIAECPSCNQPWRTRFDNLNETGRTCMKCANKNVSIRQTTHGMAKKGNWHPIYSSWVGMKERCYNKNSKQYKYYKNVEICNEWKNNFESFKNWSLNNGWKKGLEIDKDILCEQLQLNKKIYSPSTCMWIKPFLNKSFSSQKKIHNKICNVCNKEYYGTSNQKYCNKECAYNEAYRRAKEKRKNKTN